MLQLDSSVQFVTGRRRAADSSLLRRSNQSGPGSRGGVATSLPLSHSSIQHFITIKSVDLLLLPPTFFNVLHSASRRLRLVLQLHGWKTVGER